MQDVLIYCITHAGCFKVTNKLHKDRLMFESTLLYAAQIPRKREQMKF